MASINAVVLKHQQKKTDGTWNVKIRINHKSASVYIETGSFVSKASLTPKLQLKQAYIDRYFSEELSKYREQITLLGTRVKQMSAGEVKEYLLSQANRNVEIDVFAEIEKDVEALRNKTTQSKAAILISMAKYLKKFSGVDRLAAQKVTPNFVDSFSEFLSTQQSNRGGVMAANSVNTYMSHFKAFFSRLRKASNDPVTGYFPLPYNPFEESKAKVVVVAPRRNLSMDSLLKIINYKPVNNLEQRSLDLFMLSFYLCGINSKDMLVYLTDQEATTLDYRRSKVMNKRKDGGRINVVIPIQARGLVKKYAGEIQKSYSNSKHLNTTLHNGWKSISENIGFKCTMYYARHTFANIARQVCKFSKEEVSIALNHKTGSDVTDVYIDPDWSVVHKVQMGVIGAVEDYIKTSAL